MLLGQPVMIACALGEQTEHGPRSSPITGAEAFADGRDWPDGSDAASIAALMLATAVRLTVVSWLRLFFRRLACTTSSGYLTGIPWRFNARCRMPPCFPQRRFGPAAINESSDAIFSALL